MKAIKPLTDQELYDECALHVLHQAQQAYGTISCKYLTNKGLSCALGGPLVARGLYHRSYDDVGVTAGSAKHGFTFNDRVLNFMMALNLMGVQESQLELISNIQNAHDAYIEDKREFVPGFILSMFEVAEYFGLSPAVLPG